MTVYNLPPLRRENQLGATERGVWTPLEQGLRALADDLDIEQTEARPDELKSIPDAWAQIQLAADVLFEEHEAHESMLAQWRGLLALIALQPAYAAEYSLEIKGLDLATPDADSGVPSGKQTGSALKRVLFNLLPQYLQPTQAGAAIRLGIIRLCPADGGESQTIGMLTGETLVAPGRRSASIRHAGLPWLRSGLSDPLKFRDDMRPEAWTILRDYLQGLIDSIKSGTLATSRPVELTQILEAYRDDCARCAQGVGAVTPTPTTLQGWGDLFPTLARTFTAIGDERQASDCLLQMDHLAGLNGAILVDSALADSLGKPANQIRVWRNYRLHEATEERVFEQIAADAANAGYVLLRPSDFFTPYLVRLTQKSGAQIPGHPEALRNSLLPLSPLIVLFGSTDRDIASAVSATRSGNRVQIGLSLDLANGHSHTVRASYDAASTKEALPPDDLAVWPNFRAPRWPWNYLRFQYSRNEDDLRTRFGLSTEMIVQDISAGAANDSRCARLRDWAASDLGPEDPKKRIGADARLLAEDIGNVRPSDNATFQRVRFTQTAETIGEQHNVPHGISAIFFARAVEGGKRLDAVGCVIPQYEEVGKQTDSATVAIDFGTSNTIAFTSVGAEPRVVEFSNRVLFPISHERKMAEITAAYTDFFPVSIQSTPMPTVLKKREYRGKQSDRLDGLLRSVEDIEKNRHILGLSHLQFFMPRADSAGDEEFVKFLGSQIIRYINSGVLQFEIKWEDGPDARAIVKFYLRQLMIMIAAELRANGCEVRDISWRLSYPRAFTAKQTQAFKRNTSDVVAELRGLAGVENAAPTEDMHWSEAEAAAAYFLSDEDQKGVSPLVLVLDIGGGTTDIAIRADKKLIWQGSARLAAADFFRNYLANNLKVLEDIDPEGTRHFNEQRRTGAIQDPTKRNTPVKQFVDLMVAKGDFATRFDSAHALHSDHQAWVGLRETAIVALGGLLHYCGLVLNNLTDAGALKSEQLDHLTIFLGGRGSTFFRQLQTPISEHGSELAAVSRMVPAAHDVSTRIAPRFSRLPKEEVARGLLLLKGGGGEVKAPENAMPLGLGVEVEIGSDTISLSARDPVEKLAGAKLKSIDWTEFDRFLENLAKTAGLTVDISSQDADSRVRMRTRTQLGEELIFVADAATKESEAPDVSEIEPPFVTALRELVNVMAGGEDVRSSLKVKMREPM